MHKRHGTHVILTAITPAQSSVSADELVYPHLQSSTHYYRYPLLLWESGSTLLKSWRVFKNSEVREEVQVATLLMAAHRLQSAWLPHTKLFWSAQLTTRSIALFGRPLSREVANMATKELERFEMIADEYSTKLEFFEPVLKSYRSLASKRAQTSGNVEQRYAPVLKTLEKYFRDTYGEALACFDKYAVDASVSPRELIKPFRAALEILAADDPAWSTWKIVHNNSAKLCVDVPHKRIVIGLRRVPIAVDDLKGLFAHEVLVHAQRAMQGEKLSKKLGTGLPGYLIAEEGLGVLVESAVNGGVAHKVRDRYIDIALALGDKFRRPLTRQQLFEVCFVREVMRGIADTVDIDLDRVEREVWEHVNRIYRGSLGNHYVAVFTKDVAYYKGFVRMARYIEKRLKTQDIETVMKHVLSGKFDPTQKNHRERLKSARKS